MSDTASLSVGAFGDLFSSLQPDPALRAQAIRGWFDQLDESLLSRPKKPVWWGDAEDGSDRMEWSLGRALDAIRLLAVYTERPELEVPDELPASLALDPAYSEAERSGFQKAHFGHLLVADCWLPGDFDYTFRCPGPDGEDRTFGSLQALCDQCVFLRRRSFGFDREALEAMADQPIEGELPFLKLALIGLARFSVASDQARTRNVPLVLSGGSAD